MMRSLEKYENDYKKKTSKQVENDNEWTAIANYIINKSYLSQLTNRDVQPLHDDDKRLERTKNACFFPIKKIVYDQEENALQKLINVYSCAAAARINLAMLIICPDEEGIEIYLGACDDEAAISKAEVLHDAFMGNFPGSRYESNKSDLFTEQATKEILERAFNDDYKNVAAVSGIASLRGTNNNERNENFFQGLEKIIESVPFGKKYTILILAKAVDEMEINGMHEELCAIYSALSPFAKSSLSVSKTNSITVTKSIARSAGISLSESASNSFNIGIGRSWSKGETRSHIRNYNMGLGSPFINGFPFINSFHIGVGLSESKGNTRTEGVNNHINQGSVHTRGTTNTFNVTNSEGTSKASGDSQSMQIAYENKKIIELLSAVDIQLKRLKTGRGLGMFAVSTYFLSPNEKDVELLAGAYKAIISGDNTHISESCINFWKGIKAKGVCTYLNKFKHPVFYLSRMEMVPVDRMETTPATLVSVPELAIHMGLPRKSVNRIPVCRGVTFGRNVIPLNEKKDFEKKLPIGNIFHLGLKEKTKAYLNLESLTMHTFVTGTTGSGKSNTVYGLIDNIRRIRDNLKFLIVEPAKGEYKNVFGNQNDVFVYGTNPLLTPLFRINPFRFRNKVHILEHLDRLISIFNVCWPMEAAMPSILKQGIEKAYESAGWDLCRSHNRFSQFIFPTFKDVMVEVENILNESQYSDENKGNYIGALCTRLKELTTGLNSMIFVTDDLTDKELFEENVIIDLSRLGSTETKSLIMGLVTVRLQEYRQSTQEKLASSLSHITVLEEAHHLLKRTINDVGGNLAGKSVEMLTNAFAEMRSAGEGFIIADQAPGLLDMAVIRNTNTKFIMRLPAHEDRELVGRSMGLNDLQIAELTHLPTGVAATYQNDWLSPVLVQIPRYDIKNTSIFNYEITETEDNYNNHIEMGLIKALTQKNGIEEFIDKLPMGLIELINNPKLPTKVKCLLSSFLSNANETHIKRLDKISTLAFELFNAKDVMKIIPYDSLIMWKKKILSLLKPSIIDLSEYDQDTILLLLVREYSKKLYEFTPIYLNLIDALNCKKKIT